MIYIPFTILNSGLWRKHSLVLLEAPTSFSKILGRNIRYEYQIYFSQSNYLILKPNKCLSVFLKSPASLYSYTFHISDSLIKIKYQLPIFHFWICFWLYLKDDWFVQLDVSCLLFLRIINYYYGIFLLENWGCSSWCYLNLVVINRLVKQWTWIAQLALL